MMIGSPQLLTLAEIDTAITLNEHKIEVVKSQRLFNVEQNVSDLCSLPVVNIDSSI